MKKLTKSLSFVLALVLMLSCLMIGTAGAVGETQCATYKYVGKTLYAMYETNVYSGPGPSNDLLGVVHIGETIFCHSNGDNGWTQVWYEGCMAYVSTNYLCENYPRQNVNESVYAKWNANIRSGPSTRYEVIDILPANAEVTRTGVFTAGWSEIVYNGTRAYISSNFLTTTRPTSVTYTANKATVYVAYAAKVRSGPSTKSNVLTTLPRNAVVTQTHIGSNGWTKISYNGGTAYISSNFLTTIRPTSIHTHSMGRTVTAPTCTAGGYTTYACSCGYSYKNDYTDVVSHKYTSKTIAPTTSAQGYDLFTCKNCGHSFKTNYKAKLETHSHSYSSKVTAPTCTAQGYTTYTCSCGDSYKSNYKDALGHNYTVKTVAPTTTAQGYDLYTCTRCGDSYKTNYTDKVHSHSYSSKVTAPTCTAQGYTTYTCSCGDSYKSNYKSATGHNYKTETIAPTTTSQGYDLHTCQTCGYSYKDNYTDKLTTSNNGGMDTTAIYNTLIGFKSKYPEGTPFDNSVGYSWSCPYNGSVIFYNDSGCAAFASELSHAAFGRKDFVKMYNITISDVRVGDILRINNNSHSVIVLEVHSDYVVIAEANYGGTVHWGRTLTASQVANASYLISRYADRLG